MSFPRTLRGGLAFLAAHFRLRSKIFSDIRKLDRAIDSSENVRQKRILLAGSVGMNPDGFVQTVVGVGLKKRGHEVFSIICDSALGACFNCKHLHYGSRWSQEVLSSEGPFMCVPCEKKGKAYTDSAGLRSLSFSSHITPAEHLEIDTFVNSLQSLEEAYVRKILWRGVQVGEQAFAATIRFFAKPDIHEEEVGQEILKSYLRSALITVAVFDRVFRKYDFDTVIVDHGIYVPQGIIALLANRHGVALTTYATGYRAKSFIFSKGASYHYAIPRSEGFDAKAITSEQRKIASDYVQSRASGSNDWVLFQETGNPQATDELVEREKLNICLFTNVLWDAQIHFQESIFGDSLAWLKGTIEFLAKHPDVNTIVRIHPGESKGFVKSRSGVLDLLQKHFHPDVLSRIKIVKAEDAVNSYTLAESCQLSVVYGSKIGIDLAAMGHQVLVAGDCWTRGKGISIDPESTDQYFSALAKFCAGELEPKISKSDALAFAYFLYFNQMKTINFIGRKKGDPPFFIVEDEIFKDGALAPDYNSILDYLTS